MKNFVDSREYLDFLWGVNEIANEACDLTKKLRVSLKEKKEKLCGIFKDDKGKMNINENELNILISIDNLGKAITDLEFATLEVCNSTGIELAESH